MDYQNKIIVITGASSGIGEASAHEFAKKGANVVLVARNQDKLYKAEKKLSQFNKILVVQCDVSDKSDVKQMSKLVIEKFGKIDVLVNNAGFAIYGYVKDLSIEEIESQMATNYFGMVYCIKNFLPIMLEQNFGHIVNVASVAGSIGLPGIASYCASKFAMLGFSEGLKHELKSTNIGITVVSPIMVRTNFFNNSSFANMSQHSLSLSAKTVANAVVNAASSSRFEIIVPSFVRGVVWAKYTFPYLINPIINSSFRKQLDSVQSK